jgi:transporter family protein
MDAPIPLIVAATFLSWGVSGYVSKLAADRIGPQSAFWHVLFYAPAVVAYSLVVFRFRSLTRGDPSGIRLALLAGGLAAIGMVGMYILLTRAEASRMIPLTALYPALSVVLAIIFLRESVTPGKLMGILLSLVAIYLLSM